MALDLTGKIPQGELGKLLALDSTSLTRMLGLLEKRGWIRDEEGDDRRQRLLVLTPAGREKLRQSRPHWQRAQDHLHAALGKETWANLSAMLAEVTRISVQE